jgi:hypothetical protein
MLARQLPIVRGLNRPIARVKEMNAIAATPEGREARQRAATGQSLTPAQAALVKRYNELETKNNEVARAKVRGSKAERSRLHAPIPSRASFTRSRKSRTRVNVSMLFGRFGAMERRPQKRL